MWKLVPDPTATVRAFADGLDQLTERLIAPFAAFADRRFEARMAAYAVRQDARRRLAEAEAEQRASDIAQLERQLDTLERLLVIAGEAAEDDLVASLKADRAIKRARHAALLT